MDRGRAATGRNAPEGPTGGTVAPGDAPGDDRTRGADVSPGREHRHGRAPRRPGPAALAVVVAASLVTVSGSAVIASNLLRAPEVAVVAPPGAPGGTTAPSAPAQGAVPTEGPAVEEPVGDPEDSPTVEVPPASPTEPWHELPDPTGPGGPQAPPAPPDPPAPAGIPALPTLPPLAPYEPVAPPGAPGAVPEEPELMAPRVPTLAGPPTGSPLTTYPTVTGTADPGATVVVTTADGATLTTTLADGAGAWSTPVCPDASAPGACLGDAASLTVQVHALDERTEMSSAPSDPLTWDFDRPTVTVPADGGPVLSGDVSLLVEGVAGLSVELSVDGRPLDAAQRLPQPAPQLWRDAQPGTHTVSVRYVTVSGTGAVTGYGPSRSTTVEVGGPPAAPEPEPVPSAPPVEAPAAQTPAPEEVPAQDAVPEGAAALEATEATAAGLAQTPPEPHAETIGETG